MAPEPVTWSKSECADYHRKDATHFRQMAETEPRSSIRDQLVQLAHEFYRLADEAQRRLSNATPPDKRGTRRIGPL
ncbi:MAG TPA: hypothetical protein VHU44_00075 [Acidobacteriaceae bacterium]|nr:hypothetical protein [Acidobacteriaceae bacterium]